MREKLKRVFDRERLARFTAPGRLRYVSLGVVGLLVVGAALLGVVAGGDPTPASSFAGDSSSRRAVDDEAARGTDRTAPSVTPSSPSPTPDKTPEPKKPTDEPKETEQETSSGSGSGPDVDVPASCDHLSGNRAIGCAVMVDEGFGMDQWSCLNTLWDHESGWNHKAENASSGAYGIPQALPGDKMASEGDDWATNPATQVKWGLGYIKGRYDTPCGAWGFWQANNWY